MEIDFLVTSRVSSHNLHNVTKRVFLWSFSDALAFMSQTLICNFNEIVSIFGFNNFYFEETMYSYIQSLIFSILSHFNE